MCVNNDLLPEFEKDAPLWRQQVSLGELLNENYQILDIFIAAVFY